MAIVRLECLNDEQLQEILTAQKTEEITRGVSSRSLAPLGQDCERVMLGRILAVVQALLGKYSESGAADLTALAEQDLSPLEQMAIIARLGEKEALYALSGAAYERLAVLLRQLEGRTPEPVGGSVWFCMLRDTKPRLEEAQQSGQFAQHFQRLQSVPLGADDGASTNAYHTEACLRVFHWLHDVFEHPAAASAPGHESYCEWAAEADELAYLALYFEKTLLWGTYLMSQFLASGSFAISDMNMMQAEASSIRTKQSSAVPTGAALGALAKLGPLLAVGCGNGLWASLLKDRGADVLAFSQAEAPLPVVAQGGAEKVAEESSRTLLLEASDPNGEGEFGLECLRQYHGKELALLGEWRGHTFGQVHDWGQSFSEAFVDAVEKDFELVQRISLPCWPLALDSLMIWRRR